MVHSDVNNVSFYNIDFRSDFRSGLVKGDKHVIYPVLEWLLVRIPELKKRSYLAKFLMRVDVPPDIMGDVDVSDLYEQVKKTFQFSITDHGSMCVCSNPIGNEGINNYRLN